MADFVINEWLWSDISGDNGRELQRQSFGFIENFPRSNHRVIIIEGSQFDQKAWKLCKSTFPIPVQSIGGAFVKNIRQSDKALILKPESLDPLPEHFASAIKIDDHYLVQAQLAVSGAILVTTDAPLRETVLNADLPCIFRDEFLRGYL